MDGSTLFGMVSGLIGVCLGGLITLKTQRQSHILSLESEERRSRETACVALLAAVRKYRRFLMYSEPTIKEIEASPTSKGTVLVDGRGAYDAEVDEAYCRVLIVARSAAIVDSARLLTSELNDFIRIRAREGVGRVPNEVVRTLREHEESFAELVRKEIARAAKP